MKVIAEETVTRYHVELPEAETLLLKTLGWSAPPEAEPRARMWATEAEVAEAVKILAKLKKVYKP